MLKVFVLTVLFVHFTSIHTSPTFTEIFDRAYDAELKKSKRDAERAKATQSDQQTPSRKFYSYDKNLRSFDSKTILMSKTVFDDTRESFHSFSLANEDMMIYVMFNDKQRGYFVGQYFNCCYHTKR
jgi:hypothetical protein